MNNRIIPRIPEKIPRHSFIEILFDNALSLEIDAFLSINAVIIADNFVSNLNQFCYKSYKQKTNMQLITTYSDLLEKPMGRYYSFELALVCLSIASNLWDDNRYPINFVASDAKNGIVYKLQWEICMSHNFSFPSDNFLSIIYKFSTNPSQFHHKTLSKKILFLCKHICLDLSMLHSNPLSIIISLLLLRKFRFKLVSDTNYKFYLLTELIDSLSYEFDFSPSLFLQHFTSPTPTPTP